LFDNQACVFSRAALFFEYATMLGIGFGSASFYILPDWQERHVHAYERLIWIHFRMPGLYQWFSGRAIASFSVLVVHIGLFNVELPGGYPWRSFIVRSSWLFPVLQGRMPASAHLHCRFE
jgi:hypothetical protein